MNNNDTKQIGGAILIAGVLIAGAVLLKDSRPPAENYPVVNTPGNAIEAPIRPVSKEDHILGNPKAKIVIVEYSDLECPFCKVFHETMRQVMRENQDVAWVYRHYPIPALHQKAFKEAEATECAWEQGGNDAFWKYADRIFEVTTSNDGLADSELPKIAQFIGLNVPQFNTCLSSGKYAAKVQADIDNGAGAGVTGTPSSFILVGGKVVDTIPGAQPFPAVSERLKSLR